MTDPTRPDNRQQPKPRKSQLLKPETAAKKLAIYLPATPESFRSNTVTRDELVALQSDPPPWLVDLRRDGPHPRPEVARKLGVSNSGLARGGVNEALTTMQIKALLEQMPAWLVEERAKLAASRSA